MHDMTVALCAGVACRTQRIAPNDHEHQSAPAGYADVYHGTPPATAQLVSVKLSVVSLYGAKDASVNPTAFAADSAMNAMGKRNESHVFAGADFRTYLCA
jgi:hypothetical protein